MGPILIGVALVVIILMAFIISVKRDIKAFNERFPPISDAEFVARCTPGTSPEVALKVRRVVADRLGVEYERIHPSTAFIEDLGAE